MDASFIDTKLPAMYPAPATHLLGHPASTVAAAVGVVGLSVVGQSSKVISHLVRGPTSIATESRKASVQVPDGTEYRLAKLATLDLYPVGPMFKLPVAMKVPVKGATPVLNAIVP
jgi:hypothetical protein